VRYPRAASPVDTEYLGVLFRVGDTDGGIETVNGKTPDLALDNLLGYGKAQLGQIPEQGDR